MRLYVTPGLSGLELGGGKSGGSKLIDYCERKTELFHALCDFLVQLHRGEAEAETEAELATFRRAAGFQRVVFCGGEAQHTELEAILNAKQLPFRVEIDDAGPYGARKGAFQVFERMGWQNGAALDVGQTQLKVITRNGQRPIPRDQSLLPVGADALPAVEGQARIRAMVQQGLHEAEDLLGGLPDGVVLALPLEIDDAGIAKPATYPGLFGSIETIFANVFPKEWVFLNDAVLAALGHPPQQGEKTLVVTLGYGIGGALWE